MEKHAQPGRPRSEDARVAVLHAVDDLLLEIGYAAMTMKGIAETAGVGRQTVYRWWPSKAHILVEACAADARSELAIEPGGDPQQTVLAFLRTLTHFLTASPAGAAYRALLGEAQHDAAVRALVAEADLLAAPARAVLAYLPTAPDDQLAVAELCGPIVLSVLTTGRPPEPGVLETHAGNLIRAWGDGR